MKEKKLSKKDAAKILNPEYVNLEEMFAIVEKGMKK